MRTSRRAVVSCGVLAALLSLATLGCDGAGGATAARPAALPDATAFTLGGVGWALVPMGNLSQEQNTFWQVVTVRSGKGGLKVVTPEGVADNGGLVASSSGASVIVGVLASANLGFSPLAETSNGGRSWSDGVLPRSLAPGPSSLSADPEIALLGNGGSEVEETQSGLGGWHEVTSFRKLSRLSGAGVCRPTGLTAVASDLSMSSGVLTAIGAACSNLGTIAAYYSTGHGFRVASAFLPRSMSAETAEVAQFGRRVLVVGRHRSRLSLVGLEIPASGADTHSDVLSLTTGSGLQAIGTTAAGASFVVTRKGSFASPSDERLEVLATRSGAWSEVGGTLPPDTETVVQLPSGYYALSDHRSTLELYAMTPSGSWQLRDRIHVPIEYGSSS